MFAAIFTNKKKSNRVFYSQLIGFKPMISTELVQHVRGSTKWMVCHRS